MHIFSHFESFTVKLIGLFLVELSAVCCSTLVQRCCAGICVVLRWPWNQEQRRRQVLRSAASDQLRPPEGEDRPQVASCQLAEGKSPAGQRRHHYIRIQQQEQTFFQVRHSKKRHVTFGLKEKLYHYVLICVPFAALGWPMTSSIVSAMMLTWFQTQRFVRPSKVPNSVCFPG